MCYYGQSYLKQGDYRTRLLVPCRVDVFFEMFRQGEDSTQGVGLGLYAIKLVVQKLNGKIQLVANTERGVTVSLLLPAA